MSPMECQELFILTTIFFLSRFKYVFVSLECMTSRAFFVALTLFLRRLCPRMEGTEWPLIRPRKHTELTKHTIRTIVERIVEQLSGNRNNWRVQLADGRKRREEKNGSQRSECIRSVQPSCSPVSPPSNSSTTKSARSAPISRCCGVAFFSR